MLVVAPAVPRSPVSPRIRSLGLFGVLGILCVVVLGLGVRLAGNTALPIDSWWHGVAQSMQTGATIGVARVLEFIGGVGCMMVITVVLVGVFLIARRFRSAIVLVVAMSVNETLTGVLKLLFARPRPADSLSDLGLMSFPSGHTSAAAVLVVTLALLLGRRYWTPAIVWIVLMAWSRTVLEAHWLSDVTAGAILGISVALIARWAVSAAGSGRRATAS